MHYCPFTLLQKEEEYRKQKDERKKLRGGEDSDSDEVTYLEQWVEELEDLQEEVLENSNE
jgi:hypothetical protein